MIRSDEEFEAALERVSGWLETPPKAGSAEEECFHRLLCDIELYTPKLEPVQATEPPERAALRAQAEELRRHLSQHHATLMGVVGGAVRASLGRHP